MGEWFEDDSFWETFGPVLFTEERIKGAVAEVDALLALMDLAPGAHVLDLPCGVGRHALEFARRGFRVTAVDRTTRYLDAAKKRAAQEGLAIEFTQSDMRVFERPNSFDGAINLFTSFGYFEDESDDLMVARNLASSLKPGARLVVDMNGKEVLAGKFRGKDWRHQPDGSLWFEEVKVVGAWERTETRWTLIRGSARSEGNFSLRLYSGTELAALLLRSGFGEAAIYGNLAARPYDQDAERLVAVAKK
jgi:SAM-dependent methyltransferase